VLLMSESEQSVQTATSPVEPPSSPSDPIPHQSARSDGWPLPILVVLSLLGLALCAGGGWWGMHFMMDPEGERWVRQFQGHPAFTEQVGVVSSTRYDLQGTFGESHEETMVFYVQGNIGSGQLVVTEFGMKVPRVELRTAAGKTVLQEGIEGPPSTEHE
jgi:hypothetical protein